MAESARRSWLTRAEAAARWLESALLVVLFGGLMLLSVAQIALRNVFSEGLPWADGLGRLAVLWLAVIGAVAAARDRKHISIDLAQRFLPPGWRRAALAVAEAFAAAVCGFMAFYAWRFVADSRQFGDTLLGNWPAWAFQLVLPAGFAIIAYRYALRCLGRVSGAER